VLSAPGGKGLEPTLDLKLKLLNRIEDREIDRFTPYGQMKKIPDERFLRRIQSRDVQSDIDKDSAHGRTPSKAQSPTTTVRDANSVERKSPVPTTGTGETRRLGSEGKGIAQDGLSILERNRLSGRRAYDQQQ
jgi:hypothetical protein